MVIDATHEARRIACVETIAELHRELGDHEFMASLVVAEIVRRLAVEKGERA